MTQKILVKILIAAEERAEAGHFNITIRTTSGKTYQTWDEDLDAEDADFVAVFWDDTWTYIPYSNIESIEA